MTERRQYTKAFKLEAAKLVTEQGYTPKQAGDRLGVSPWNIRDWVKACRNRGALPPASQTAPAAEEFNALREENRRLKMEVEILKKAAAYFAQDSL